MRFSLQEFLFSISMALDFIEMDLLHDVTFHNRRVAYISEKMGRSLRLPEDQLAALTRCALLHDVGMGTYAYKTKKNAGEADGPKEHCTQGQALVDALPMKDAADVILYHHEAYDGSGFFGLKCSDIPLFSQIISLADKVDIHLRNGDNRHQIRQWVSDREGAYFSGEIVGAFLAASAPPAFWIDLNPLYITKATTGDLTYVEADWDYICQITRVFTRLVDMKSAFTARHSSGLAEKAEVMAAQYRFDPDTRNQFVIAAHLHDLGKLAIPNAILDKPGKLDKEEFEIIQRHTYYTRKALEPITGFENITEWAANHHERLTGQGYPYGSRDLDFASRVMGVLDIYQALTEDRPYRAGMSHAQAMDIIKPMAAGGGLDRQITEDVDGVFGEGVSIGAPVYTLQQ